MRLFELLLRLLQERLLRDEEADEMTEELRPKHGYRRWMTKHGPASARKGKTDRKRAQRAERAVVRGKFRALYPDAPNSREQAMKRPERTPPPEPPPPAAPATSEGGG